MKLSLPKNISKLRKERSMTQEQLAEALGVTFASVSKWERAVLLLSQNVDPDISEVSIKGEVATCYLVLGNHPKGVEILKKYNVCGVHNPLISIALTDNDITHTNMPGFGVDKVIAPCYSGSAAFSFLLGETETAKLYMRRAYKAAILYDSAPIYKIENIKYCIGDMQNTTAYDDLGESATALVIKQLTQEKCNEQLLGIWKKIVEEETCGGAE